MRSGRCGRQSGLKGGRKIRIDHAKVRELREQGLKYREIAGADGDFNTERGPDPGGAAESEALTQPSRPPTGGTAHSPTSSPNPFVLR